MEESEKVIIYQEWYETDQTRTGWDSFGWSFENGEDVDQLEWDITEYIDHDKFGHPTKAYAIKIHKP